MAQRGVIHSQLIYRVIALNVGEIGIEIASRPERYPVRVLRKVYAKHLESLGHLFLGSLSVRLHIEIVRPRLRLRGHTASIGVDKPSTQDGAGHVRAVSLCTISQLILLNVNAVAKVGVEHYVPVPDTDTLPLTKQTTSSQKG